MNKPTVDVVLTHRSLFAAKIGRQVNPKVIGIDIPKAFDTVRRTLLIQLLEEIIYRVDLRVIERLFSHTTVPVKRNKMIDKKFPLNEAFPREMQFCRNVSISKIFVNEAFIRIDNIANNNDQNYRQTGHNLPSHIENAEDTNFILIEKMTLNCSWL